MKPFYSKITKTSNREAPRARAIIEFIEGDLTRPPIIYPTGNGSDEQDEAIREAIIRRWQ